MSPIQHPRAALVTVGIAFLAVYPLVQLWPAGFGWRPVQPEYEQMISMIYAILGIFLIHASRAPDHHTSLIWFTVWSSLGHAAIMAVHAAADPTERMHLAGDVPALTIMAAVLALSARAARRSPRTTADHCQTD